MERKELSVQTKGFDEIKFYYNLPETVEEAIQMFEGNVVNEFFNRALIINAQANARKLMALKYTTESIQAAMDQWKPGVKLSTSGSVRAVDPVKLIAENFADWTPERQAEVFALIQERFNNRGQSSPTTPVTNNEGEEPTEPTEEEMAAMTAGVNGDTHETEAQTEQVIEQTDYDPREGRRRR